MSEQSEYVDRGCARIDESGDVAGRDVDFAIGVAVVPGARVGGVRFDNRALFAAAGALRRCPQYISQLPLDLIDLSYLSDVLAELRFRRTFQIRLIDVVQHSLYAEVHHLRLFLLTFDGH